MAIQRELSIMGLRAHRPSSPEISKFLTGRYVVALTGHRWNKLGGYHNEIEQIQNGDGNITSFTGTFAFLGNFASSPLEFEGLRYKTAEAAFQGAKTFDRSVRRKIAAAKTPAEAKKLAYELIVPAAEGCTAPQGKALLRSDWNEVRVSVMETILRAKFSSLALQNKLMATGSRALQHGNAHNDSFWGLVKGAGENHLGLLLEKLRMEFNQQYDHKIPNPQAILEAAMIRRLQALKDIHGDKLLVISGAALGVDITGAKVCRKLDIDYVAAVPFPKQASLWPDDSKREWASLVRFSYGLVCVGSDDLADTDIHAAMQWRNEWMVDNSHEILALWDGTQGGTGNCVAYANAQGKKVCNMHSDWQAFYAASGQLSEMESAVGKELETPDGVARVLRTEIISSGPYNGSDSF